jgi:hypothetical protein
MSEYRSGAGSKALKDAHRERFNDGRTLVAPVSPRVHEVVDPRQVSVSDRSRATCFGTSLASLPLEIWENCQFSCTNPGPHFPGTSWRRAFARRERRCLDVGPERLATGPRRSTVFDRYRARSVGRVPFSASSSASISFRRSAFNTRNSLRRFPTQPFVSSASIARSTVHRFSSSAITDRAKPGVARLSAPPRS